MKPTVLLFLWLVTVNLIQAAPVEKKSGDGEYDNYGQRKYLVIKLHGNIVIIIKVNLLICNFQNFQMY